MGFRSMGQVEEFLFFHTIAKSSPLLSTLLRKMMSAHTFYTSIRCQSSPSVYVATRDPGEGAGRRRNRLRLIRLFPGRARLFPLGREFVQSELLGKQDRHDHGDGVAAFERRGFL